MYQYTDTMALALKAAAGKGLVEFFSLNNLPSSREAKIQVAKFEKMIKAFDKKFPPELLRTISERKFAKERGMERHRVNQQSKVVDRLLMQLAQEMVVESLKDTPGDKRKPTKGQIKSATQRLIHNINSIIYKEHQKALKEAYDSVARVLGGGC